MAKFSSRSHSAMWNTIALLYVCFSSIQADETILSQPDILTTSITMHTQPQSNCWFRLSPDGLYQYKSSSRLGVLPFVSIKGTSLILHECGVHSWGVGLMTLNSQDIQKHRISTTWSNSPSLNLSITSTSGLIGIGLLYPSNITQKLVCNGTASFSIDFINTNRHTATGEIDVLFRVIVPESTSYARLDRRQSDMCRQDERWDRASATCVSNCEIYDLYDTPRLYFNTSTGLCEEVVQCETTETLDDGTVQVVREIPPGTNTCQEISRVDQHDLPTIPPDFGLPIGPTPIGGHDFNNEQGADGFDGVDENRGVSCECNHGTQVTDAVACSCSCDSGWRTLSPSDQLNPDNWTWCSVSTTHHTRPDLDGNGTIILNSSEGSLDQTGVIALLVGIVGLSCASCCYCCCCKKRCSNKAREIAEYKIIAKFLERHPQLKLYENGPVYRESLSNPCTYMEEECAQSRLSLGDEVTESQIGKASSMISMRPHSPPPSRPAPLIQTDLGENRQVELTVESLAFGQESADDNGALVVSPSPTYIPRCTSDC